MYPCVAAREAHLRVPRLMQLKLPDKCQHEIRDAARLAVQSAASAAIVFVLMHSLGLPEVYIGVLTAVLIVEPSIGSTLGQASDRFLATLVGSLIGLVCLLLLPDGYGTAAALALSMLVINAVAAFKPGWRYGVVAAVAISLGAESDALQTAMDRGIAIALGIAVGTVVSLVLWPDAAETRAERYLRAAISAIGRRMTAAVEGARLSADEDDAAERRQYHDNISNARSAAEAIRFADGDTVREKIETVSRLYNSVLIVNRVAESSDGVISSNEAFQQNIENIRRCGSELVEALVQGDTDQDQRLERIGDAISAIRKMAAHSGPGDHVLQDVLVFGLEQLAADLHSLCEVCRKPVRSVLRRQLLPHRKVKTSRSGT